MITWQEAAAWWHTDPYDEILRAEAAAITGYHVEELLPAKVLSGVTSWLYRLLSDARGILTEAKLIVVCKCFDPVLLISDLEASLKLLSTAPTQKGAHMGERKFYYWIVLMFGGNTSLGEFFDGVNSFARAARRVAGAAGT